MNERISLIYSRNPKERIPLLINILDLYGIKEQKTIYMQSFLLRTSYYVNRLISHLSKINFQVIESYMFPVGAKTNALKEQKINVQDFILALEKVRHANIVISSSKVFPEQDWVDIIFDFDNEYQIIIIDSLEDLLKNTTKSFKCLKNTMEKYSQRYNAQIILFMNEKEFKKYNFTNWQVSSINHLTM